MQDRRLNAPVAPYHGDRRHRAASDPRQHDDIGVSRRTHETRDQRASKTGCNKTPYRAHAGELADQFWTVRQRCGKRFVEHPPVDATGLGDEEGLVSQIVGRYGRISGQPVICRHYDDELFFCHLLASQLRRRHRGGPEMQRHVQRPAGHAGTQPAAIVRLEVQFHVWIAPVEFAEQGWQARNAKRLQAADSQATGNRAARVGDSGTGFVREVEEIVCVVQQALSRRRQLQGTP